MHDFSGGINHFSTCTSACAVRFQDSQPIVGIGFVAFKAQCRLTFAVPLIDINISFEKYFDHGRGTVPRPCTMRAVIPFSLAVCTPRIAL